jgi:hypothetical protein
MTKIHIGGVAPGSFDENTFQKDKKIFQIDNQSGKISQATIVSWKPIGTDTGIIYACDVRGVFQTFETGNGVFDYEDGLSPSLTGIVITNIEKPEVVLSSGEMLYIQNIRPVIRNSEQGEEFRISIGF